MRTKIYRITNKHDVTLGIVIATSYDKAFELFREQSPMATGQTIYGVIIDPEELHLLLITQLGIGLLRAHK
ncbi:hypothetical protein [uncultured Spirosoma sp.]|uniref:hypothetical protein n=1 Tax=uncultured Spirosoma sp. TaxID=278208 RepID=UPI00258A59C9|nr:hypothetical protein [uncultured Spirosoma sp.]